MQAVSRICTRIRLRWFRLPAPRTAISCSNAAAGRWYTQKDKEKNRSQMDGLAGHRYADRKHRGHGRACLFVCGKKESRVLEKEAAATAEELEQELLKLINTARTENGAAELQLVTRGRLQILLNILRRTIPKNTKRNPRSSTQSINMQADRTDMRQSAKRLRLL